MYKNISKVKIIGGFLRGSVIRFKHNHSLRPTLGIVKETLFNWLAPIIKNSNVLDLFAGSGALSFESYSRGATLIVSIENNTESFSDILSNKKRLVTVSHSNSHEFNVINNDSFIWVKNNNNKNNKPFRIVYFDPPFRCLFLKDYLYILIKNHWIDKDSVIFYEINKDMLIYNDFSDLNILQQKKSGNVFCFLFKCTF